MPTPPAATASRLTGVVAGGLAVAFGVGALLARHRPPWGDEAHFFDTIQLFTHGISLELLRTYPEMSSPLPFILYGGWGAAFGADLPTLRLLSPIVAWLTAVLFWSALVRLVDSVRARLVTIGAVVLSPYFVGVALFVFTDMLALLGLAIVLRAVAGRRPWLAAFGLAVGVLSRQYLAFMAPALMLAAVVARDVTVQDRRQWIQATLAGMVPLGLLVALWGGLSPDNALRDVYLGGSVRFDPHALSLYLALPGIYLAPLLLLVERRHRAAIWWAFALSAGACVIIWPVEAAAVQTSQGIQTVGFLHRALVAMLPPTGVPLAFALSAFVGILVLGPALWPHPDDRAGAALSRLVPVTGVVCYMLVMPFSYMPWEKYALPLCMIAAVGVAAGMSGRAAGAESPH